MSEPARKQKLPIAHRFRGYLPVALDLETGGFNSKTDALLECAFSLLEMTDDGDLVPGERIYFNVEPFEGANLEQSALDFTGIDPHHPFRMAVPEEHALAEAFKVIRSEIKRTGCNRAIIVAHNASFDQAFLNAAVDRCGIKRNPFHSFSSFDTASLCGLVFGQTVFARACEVAGMEFDNDEAHTAKYDCDKTAELFCIIVNKWRHMGGWSD